ncbi:MAG: hypothetical protein MUF04_07435, partial [Akkermansiaceae bacterium]|nr:hypothetical protein [Akkermansiaceae bacterium]
STTRDRQWYIAGFVAEPAHGASHRLFARTRLASSRHGQFASIYLQISWKFKILVNRIGSRIWLNVSPSWTRDWIKTPNRWRSGRMSS